MRKAVLGWCVWTLAGIAFAGGTRAWEHAAQADFEKGAIKGLALRSDGRLSLAPAFTELHDASAAYLWAAVEDSKGNLYSAGSANDGKVAIHVVDAAGKGKVLTELAGLSIYALAVDSQDRLYAGTSPDGKVYRIAAGGNSSEVFYDPKAKYIWALAFNPNGELLVATGDKGELHRVTAAGAGSVLFKADDANVRSLAVEPKGTIFAGTEPAGQILRISPAGEGFVLYQSPKREITSLALDAQGALYAAAVGNKQPGGGGAPPPPPPPAPSQQQPAPAGGVIVVGNRPSTQPQAPLSMGPAVAGGSEVIRVESDGYPRKVWSHASELAYSLAFGSDGRLLIGTGNKGGIYRVDSDHLWTWILGANPTQITSLIAGRGGRIYAITGNIGKIYRLGPDTEKQGTMESEVLDASFFTYWGRIHYTGQNNGGSVKIETRSGNVDTPQRNWSGWAEVPMARQAGRIASPAARFLQYRLTLTGAASPEIAGVDIAYQPKNVAPQVEIVETTPANYRFPPQTLTMTPSQNITLPVLGRNARPSTSFSTDTAPTSMNYAKGHVGARWLARDDNDDSLVYKLEIRGAKETAWRLLKDGIKDRGYSWDSAAFADGQYVLRVTASDAPGNPPAQALSGSIESEPFVIDNTPPRIDGLTAARNGSRVEVKWRAADALNVVETAEYSVDGGEWKRAEPTTRLADSLEHDYVLAIDDPGPGEHTIAVRVSDEFDNQSVEKTVVR